MSKLRSLKLALKKWNNDVFGNVESKLKEAEEELHNLDLMAESRNLNEMEITRKKEALGLIWQIQKRKEWLWLQKSRLDWALKGDKNTRFFHLMASMRQNRNMINSMKIDEVTVEEPAEVKQAICDYFKKHFDKQWRYRPIIGGNLQQVNPSQASEFLEKDFTKAEVWDAIRESDGNKAPGPDGFNMMCF